VIFEKIESSENKYLFFESKRKVIERKDKIEEIESL